MDQDEGDRHGRARVDNFVDAAFAFAVTLLIISVGDPPSDLDGLRQALLRIPAFLAGFALLALFWWAHLQFARMRPRAGGASLLFSLAVVFVILVYVFPLRLLMESAMFVFSGGRLPGAQLIGGLTDLRFLYAVYAAGFLVLAGLYTAMFGYASAAARKAGDAARAREAGDTMVTWGAQVVAAVLSLMLALGPFGALPLLIGAPGWIYGVAGGVITLYWTVWVPRRERRRLAAEAADAAAQNQPVAPSAMAYASGRT